MKSTQWVYSLVPLLLLPEHIFAHRPEESDAELQLAGSDHGADAGDGSLLSRQSRAIISEKPASGGKLRVVSIADSKPRKVSTLMQSLQVAGFTDVNLHRIISATSSLGFFNWTQRLATMKDILENASEESDETVYLFVDSFDTFALGSPKELLAKFQRTERDVLFSCVTYPYPHECGGFDWIQDGTCKPGGWGASCPNWCRFINAGAFIGKKGALSKILEENTLQGVTDDQCYFNYVAAKRNYNIGLDWKQDIFFSTTDLLKCTLERTHGRLKVTATGALPQIMHFDTTHPSVEHLYLFWQEALHGPSGRFCSADDVCTDWCWDLDIGDMPGRLSASDRALFHALHWVLPDESWVAQLTRWAACGLLGWCMDGNWQPTNARIPSFMLFDNGSPKAASDSQLENRAEQLRMPLKILDLGRSHAGESAGMRYALQELADLDDRRLIVLSLHRDVLLNVAPSFRGDFASLLEAEFGRLTRFNPEAVLVAAESRCCVSALDALPPGGAMAPDGSRRAYFCSGENPRASCAPGGHMDEWKAKMKDLAQQRNASSANVYLHAGFVTGRVKALRLLFESLHFKDFEDHQALLAEKMLQRPDLIFMDYEQVLFGINAFGAGPECNFQIASDEGVSGVVAKDSGAQPLFLQFSAQQQDCKQRVGSALDSEGAAGNWLRASLRFTRDSSRVKLYSLLVLGLLALSCTGAALFDSCSLRGCGCSQSQGKRVPQLHK